MASRSKEGQVVVEDDMRNASIEHDGRFRMEGLAPGAVVDLRVTAGDVSEGGARTVHVKGVKAGTEDLRVVFEEGVSITGVVVDAKGRRVRSGSVMAKPLPAVARADREIARIADRPRRAVRDRRARAGPHELKVESDEGGTALLTVDAPAHDVRVVVPFQAKLRGRLTRNRRSVRLPRVRVRATIGGSRKSGGLGAARERDDGRGRAL